MNGQQTATLLRNIIKDYNYWGESESDTPVKVYRTKKQIEALVVDKSMRRKALLEIPENREVIQKTINEVFVPLIQNSYTALEQKYTTIADDNYSMMEMETEALEYYVQLKSVFDGLTDTAVYYVDAPNDSYTGLIIKGKTTDGETITCRALLTQT